MLLQKYENLLQNLNSQIACGNFDIEKNKEKLEKIIEIYKNLKAKNYDVAKSLIENLGLEEKLDIPLPCCPAPEGATFYAESDSKTRDWDIETIDEDNIEAFNSIEMMSAIFLQNIKDKIGTQK